ncbi:MAG: type I glyceraldehyde-3-phosphate dehydrogenase [Bdellovibrionales bacterium RBG_16_40_8]|nr:MAG: type I glyceraldehyde-3-phosphate dehydrogenase [Bdellovibrionales bacterium RBG_16_40_8]
MAKLKVAINGFGRIGRIFLRAGFEKIDIVAINDLCDSKISAHLLKYDSIHRTFDKSVSCDETHLIVGDKKIRYSKIKDPTQLPWKELGVDVVLECTGVFTDKEGAAKHLLAGAKRVIVSAPAKNADLTVVFGINHEQYDPKNHTVLSNASCTTNCLAPVAKVIHDTFGIEQGLMTTIHSYTNDQPILDAPHKDLRRARAGAISMIPTTTGAAKAVGLVIPELNGKLNGIAVRVPTPNVSLVDLVVTTKKEVTAESVNQALREASAGRLNGILHCEDNPLVSSDFIGNAYSSNVDTASTMVMGSHMVKVYSWYDNEYAFSLRMVDLALYMQSRGI